MKKDQLPKNRLEYLEAFPFYHSVLDICHLESGERAFAGLLTERLLSGKLDVTFQSSSQSEEKLHHLYFDSKSWERMSGQRCSALGFPLLLCKQESSVKMIPLLFWPVALDPDQHRANFWTIRAQPGRSPEINPLLANLFPSEDPLPLPPWKQGQDPSVKTIQEYGKSLGEWLSATWQETWVEPFPIPPMEVLGELAEQRVILPCMVMGSFKPAFPVNEEGSSWAFEDYSSGPRQNPQPFEISLFSPFQAAAWERAHASKAFLVENKARAETRDWVLNLIYNALCNGERCLILSDRVSRLSRLQAGLAAKGLDGLFFVMTDPHHDSYLLAELLKARANKEEVAVPFAKNDYKAVLAKCIRHKEKLDRAYLALKKPLLGMYNWTDLTGLFLRSSAIEGKELLSSQMTAQDFQFQSDEYEELKEIINRSIPLYNRINTLKHPLAVIHPSRILDFDKPASLKNIEGLIREYSEVLEKLNHEVLRMTDVYALKLNDHFENGFLALNARLLQTLELYSDHSNKFGEAFEKSGTSVLRLKGIFQHQAKALKAAIEETTQAYQALARKHNTHNFFDFDFLSPAEARNMARIKANLLRFKESLGEWRQRIRDRVTEEVNRLNKQTAFPDLGMQDTIANLEDKIDTTLHAFNQAGLYGDSVDANMLTIPKKQKFLDGLLEKLETTRLNLRDFDPFYDWHRHWLQLKEPQQRLVRALIKVKPKNWLSAFESWYFHHCLNRSFSDDLPTDDQVLQSFYEAWAYLQAFLPDLIRHTWQEREHKAIKNWKKNNRPGYLEWLGKAKREGSPSDWFGGNWDAFHDLFPVWMMPDSLAATLYDPQSLPELDWVIVWENQEIEPAVWDALAPKVKHWVFVGDGKGKNTARLKEKGWPFQTIDALPVQRIFEDLFPAEAMPEDKNSLQTLQVNGLYDFSKHTNEAEAQEALRLLNEIRPTPSRTFPSVAIITLTTEQRDLIATYLLQIKQRNLQGSEKIRSLERNGLAVMQIDEFFGSSFDQIIFSATYGPVNIQGALPNDLANLASDQWGAMVQALRQVRFSSCHLLLSFTPEQLTDPRLESLNSLARNLAGFPTPAASKGMAGGEPEFNKEIRVIMQGYFDDWKFKQSPVKETHAMPLLLSHGKNPDFQAAILPDLFFGNTAYSSYTWEWEARKRLSEYGVFIQNAWSVLFWRNPRQEARKIAARIISTYNRNLKDSGKRGEALPPEEPPASDAQ